MPLGMCRRSWAGLYRGLKNTQELRTLSWRKIVISLPIWVLSANAGSIKGDVKNIFLPPPGAAVLICDIQPLSPRRRSGVVALNDCISADWHLLQQRRRRSVSKQIKPCGCTVATMDLSEAHGLVLFRVVRRGIGISRRLSASGTLGAYRRLGCSPSNPSVSRTNGPPPEEDRRRWKGLFTGDAQAACDFSFATSKFSPFFHRISVMAAILRASVRRAMVGLMPLASDRW